MCVCMYVCIYIYIHIHTCKYLLQLNTKIFILVDLVFVHFEVSEGLFVLKCE